MNTYPKSFTTKTGTCQIQPDKIVLIREGFKGSVAKLTLGNSLTHTLVVYGILLIFVFYFALESYGEGNIIQSILFSFLGLYLIIGLLKSRNISVDSTIERNRIIEVKFYRAKPKLTRSRFEIYFKNENGKIKKRLILLPGTLNNGEEATEQALKIMREERLIEE